MLKALVLTTSVLAASPVLAQDVLSALNGTWAEADCSNPDTQWVVLPGTLITPTDQCSMATVNADGTSSTVEAKCLPRDGSAEWSTNFTFEMTGESAMTIAGQQLFVSLKRCGS